MRFSQVILILIFASMPVGSLFSMEDPNDVDFEAVVRLPSLKVLCIENIINQKVSKGIWHEYLDAPPGIQELLAERDCHFAASYALRHDKLNEKIINLVAECIERWLSRITECDTNQIYQVISNDLEILQIAWKLLAMEQFNHNSDHKTKLLILHSKIIKKLERMGLSKELLLQINNDGLQDYCNNIQNQLLQIANMPAADALQKFLSLPVGFQELIALENPQFAFEYTQKNNEVSSEIAKLAVKYITDRPEKILPVRGLPFQFKMAYLKHDLQTLKLIRKLRASPAIAQNVNCISQLDMYQNPMINQYVGLGIFGGVFSIFSGLGGGFIVLCSKLFLPEEVSSIKIGIAAGAMLGAYKFPAFVRSVERFLEYGKDADPSNDIGGYNRR